MSNEKRTKYKKILMLIAMEVESQPIIEFLKMQKLLDVIDKRLPIEAFVHPQNPNIILVRNGICPFHKIDRIGTAPAVLAAWESIKIFSPDLILNAGTAGGFARNGSKIGDSYLSDGTIAYHDHHIPLEAFKGFCSGNYPSVDAKEMAKALELKLGRVTTGDSFTTTDESREEMVRLNTHCKDMEAAGIASVAQLAGIDMMCLKIITDLVDTQPCSSGEFLENYKTAVHTLAEKVVGVLRYLSF